MRWNDVGRTAGLAGLVVGTVMVLSGCVGDGDRDAGGMTRAEVAELSLHEEFDLFGERYLQMQEVLEEAQLQVSAGPWGWSGGDVLPNGAANGGFGPTLHGADGSNTYFLRASRFASTPGEFDSDSRLELMQRYFDSKGWPSYVEKFSHTSYLTGNNGDGHIIVFGTEGDSSCFVKVYSELYWTNDSSELLGSVADRVEAGFPAESLPGDFEDLPKWTDPILYRGINGTGIVRG